MLLTWPDGQGIVIAGLAARTLGKAGDLAFERLETLGLEKNATDAKFDCLIANFQAVNIVMFENEAYLLRSTGSNCGVGLVGTIYELQTNLLRVVKPA
jgi:hypothetical protein